MKVLVMTLGTRGDVQPFVALAQGLRGAGHEAVLDGGIRSRLELMPKMAALFSQVLDDSWAVARDAGADLVVHNGQTGTTCPTPRSDTPGSRPGPGCPSRRWLLGELPRASRERAPSAQ